MIADYTVSCCPYFPPPHLPAPQDIPFFDRHENSTAAMLSTLSADAAAVRGMLGDRLGHLATVAACVVGSYATALKSR